MYRIGKEVKMKISIVVPVYNVESYLKKCVLSIMNQSYGNLEIIIINDGSTDKSGIICSELAKIDKRIKVIHKKNGGLSSARNEGINHVTGDFIGFVDSDDWIEENMYEILLNNLIKTRADVSVCNFYKTYLSKEEKYYKGREKELSLNSEKAMEYLLENKIYGGHVWSKLYRKELFNEIYFNSLYDTICEDLIVNWKIFKKSRIITFTNFAGYHYFQRKGSLSQRAFSQKIFHGITAFKIILNESSRISVRVNSIAFYRYKLFVIITFFRALSERNLEEKTLLILKKMHKESLFAFLKNSNAKLAYKIFSVFLLIPVSISRNPCRVLSKYFYKY